MYRVRFPMRYTGDDESDGARHNRPFGLRAPTSLHDEVG